MAEPLSDSIRIDEIVITGTRSESDARHLSQTVNVIGRGAIEEQNRLSVMPLLAEQVPGMFITSRSILGYGISGGAAGNISMRGLSGSSALIENDYGNTNGAISLFYNWGDHWINDGHMPGDSTLFHFTSNDDMYGASAWQSAELFEGNRVTIGLDFFSYGGQARNDSVNGKRFVIADKHEYEQAGMAFHLPAQAELKLSATKGFRYPTMKEMYMFPPKNPDLEPESMWNYELAQPHFLC